MRASSHREIDARAPRARRAMAASSDAVRAVARSVAAGGAVVLALAVLAGPAHAATVAAWADWAALSGGTGAWSGEVTSAAAGLGPATMSSTSLGGGSVGVVSGATRWLGPSSPPGALHGSSRDRPYVSLAHATVGTASVTTYTFAQPAPGGSWSLVLGDVDLERLTVSATAPDGTALTAEELGWAGAFNYCAGTGAAEPPCNGTDRPTASTAATSVTLEGLGASTDGAAGWLRPTVAVATLTVRSERLATATTTQLYQTWFATLARDVTGTVVRSDVPGTPVAGATVTLTGPSGAPLATQVTAVDGTYAFTGWAAGAGYEVAVTAPAGLLVAGAASLPVDLSTGDATAGFALRAPVPVVTRGSVVDPVGTPVAGVVVTLADGTGASVTAVTAADGTWSGGPLGVGTWTVHLVAPPGHVVVEVPDPVVVADGDEGPRTLVDGVVREAVPVSVAGSVLDDAGAPLAGVALTLTGPAGATATATSAADGSWSAGPLLPGTWSVAAAPPTGWAAVSGPAPVTVAAGQEGGLTVDPTVLRRRAPVLATGVVQLSGEPVAGAVITLTSGDGTVVVATSAADGTWTSGPLLPGSWTVRITAPDGLTVLSAPRTLTLAVDAEGVTTLPTVVLTAVRTAPLAVTGADPAAPATTALTLVSLGLLLVAASRRRAPLRGTHPPGPGR